MSSPDNLSFVLNTDGAPVFKSSKVSIWPVFLVINELPFKIRMKKENAILAALWFGNEKPAMGTFLKPLQASFMKLKDGIKCFSPEGGEFLSKSFLFVATADFKDCRIYHAKFRPGIKKTREKLKTLLSME